MTILSDVNSRQTDRGFTLVELLVVIAIIGVLVALLLPAVQSAREAARRMQCQNNLKQMGLAALNYETARSEFPSGGYITGNTNTNRWHAKLGWSVYLLPYLEQQNLYDQFDLERSYLDGGNAAAGRTFVGTFLCPSDEFSDEFVKQEGNSTPLLAPSSYKGVSGSIDLTRTAGSPVYWDRRVTNPSNGIPDIYEEFSLMRGALTATGPGYLQPTRMTEITDGTSQTAFIGEYHTLTEPDVRKSVWASAYRYFSKGAFVRGSLFRSTPDVKRCAELASQIYDNNGNFLCLRPFTSIHAGGIVNFAFCDGSVNSLSVDIDDEIYLNYGTIGGGLNNGPVNGSTPGPPPPPPPPR